MSTDPIPTPTNAAWPDYRAVWRWHFYAGLFCIPFVLILSVSGSLYLFKSEIEAWEERKFDSLAASGSAAALPSRRIHAALEAVPGSRFSSYELPKKDPNSATRVVVRKGSETLRVFVHPRSLEVLGQMSERGRVMRFVKTIHGELMLGPRGSYLVELAACWTIVMILTGLYLWWPRNSKGWGGLLYPRWGVSSRVFWKDLHSVPGMWISGMALVLLLSGLPWSNFWGDYFRTVRRWTGTAVARQDWSNRGESGEESGGSGGGEHQGHNRTEGSRTRSGGGRWQGGGESLANFDITDVDRVVPAIEPFNLSDPVAISPPMRDGGNWTIRSNTPNRPLRVTLTVNGKTGEIVSRENFSDRHILDQIVGYGIAIHEGQLFGPANQILGLLTATGLVLLCVSGVVLWWRRRDRGILGAPHAAAMPRFSLGLLMIVVGLGIYLPMFGASLLMVLLLERLAFRRIPGVRQWLGLQPEAVSVV